VIDDSGQMTEDRRQIIINPEGSHGLHQDPFKLQTMTALIKSFCRGPDVSRAVFSKRAPWFMASGGSNACRNVL